MTTKYEIRGVNGKLLIKGLLDNDRQGYVDVLNNFNVGCFDEGTRRPYKNDVLTNFYVLDMGEQTFVRVLSNATIKTNCEIEMREVMVTGKGVSKTVLTKSRDRVVIGIFDSEQKIGTIHIRNLKSE